jgi:1-acyl-sn-glycerol-3-phosphate acyltransferase
MQIRDLEDRKNLWPELVRDLRYVTPPGMAGWMVRNIPGWATIKYHAGVSSVIHGVARTAAAGKFDTSTFATCCHDVLHIAEACGGMVDVEGVEHVRNNVPAVFVSNHMGSLETFVVAGLILPFGDATFVLKESLMRYPVLRHLVAGINPVPVSRVNPRDDLKCVLKFGVEKLQAGISMIIFPQATRSPVFDMHKFNTLGAKLAARAGVPLVPLAVKTDFLAPGKIFKDFGIVDQRKSIRFRFGPPIRIGDQPKADHRIVMDFIASSLTEWGLSVIRSDESFTSD